MSEENSNSKKNNENNEKNEKKLIKLKKELEEKSKIHHKRENNEYHSLKAEKKIIKKKIELLESKININRSQKIIMDKKTKRNSTMAEMTKKQDQLTELRLKKKKAFFGSYYKNKSDEHNNYKLTNNLKNLKTQYNLLTKEIQTESLKKANKNKKNESIRSKHNETKKAPISIFSTDYWSQMIPK